MDKYFGLSSPAIISFWVIRRSGDVVFIGTNATRGASIGDVSSEHGDSHSRIKQKEKKKNYLDILRDTFNFV